MARKAYVRTTKAGLIFSLIFILIFLAIGVVFFTVLAEDGAGIGMVFMGFWILIVLLMGGGVVYNLANYGKKAERSMADEIVLPDGASDAEGAPAADFADRLRKLEGLRKDGLITEAEFARKRAEIMDGRW